MAQYLHEQNREKKQGEEEEDDKKKLAGAAKSEFESIKEVLESKKQVVFYGPIGVGKTYLAKQFAIWFETGEYVEDPVRIGTLFDDLRDKRVLEFVQFQPSYSYEDFVEGIRPIVKGQSLSYEVRPGIFKLFCSEAASGRDNYNAKVGTYQPLNNPLPIDINLGQYGIHKRNHKEFGEMVHGLKPEDSLPQGFENLDQFSGFFILRHQEGSPYADREGQVYHYTSEIPGSKQLTDALDQGKVAFGYLDKKRGGIFGLGFLEGYSKTPPASKRIFIIDEINRGNIPKIFGELLYALEYRGEKVKLQYSGADSEVPESEKFLNIPPNIFIVGTMNTADRSIALVDVALRRRFSFIQFMPNYDLLAKVLSLGDRFDEGKLRTDYETAAPADKRKILSVLALRQLNVEIAMAPKLGKDKQIGHSFLMKLKDDQPSSYIVAWRYDIIPLMEEYYYGNYSELKRLFGEAIVDPTEGIRSFTEAELTESLEKLCNLAKPYTAPGA
ncbi:MAG: AAA family ATPase [Nitrososphaerales archaeon]|jgi:5-methylcytosine-specific restriction protein B